MCGSHRGPTGRSRQHAEPDPNSLRTEEMDAVTAPSTGGNSSHKTRGEIVTLSYWVMQVNIYTKYVVFLFHKKYLCVLFV